MPFRLPLLALAAVVLLGACDTNEFYETRDVAVVDFRLDTSDPSVSADGRVASFDDLDTISPDDRDDLQRVLAQAGDGALVVAYIDTEVVLDVTTTGQTYSALPITRGYEGDVLVDEDGDGTFEVVPFVDFLVTYEYSFDNGAFYFDVTSSAALDFTAFLPSAVDFRVVVVPADLFYGQAGARIDFRDYAAVKAAYNLPD